MKELLTPQYIAGFFDGEGSLWIQNHHKSCGLRVSISQADSHILYMIKETYGGKVDTWKSKVNNKDVSQWCLENGMDCYNFLKIIYPYLIIKKIQVEFAFRFMELPWRQYGKGGFRKKLTTEQREMDEMFAYSIKIAKPKYWENYTDINSDEELVDFIFSNVCKNFN